MTQAFGLPVKGDIQHYARSQVEQYPIEQLEPYIRAMLADEDVIKFGWAQYTPYFNDGDACVFSTYGVFAVTKESTERAKVASGVFYDENDLDRWDHVIRTYAYGDDPKSPQHHIDFMDQLESGHYDNDLESTFGDPALVIITKEGITVEYYSHE